jgi:hypothetical protein
MLLRVWILGILLIVVTWIIWNWNQQEGFQALGQYTLPTPANDEQARNNFWTILNEQKAWNVPKNTRLYTTNFDAGSSIEAEAGSGTTKALLKAVQYPGKSDKFTAVFPNYISIYALAKYKKDPVAARYALINNYNGLQEELESAVQSGSERTADANYKQNPELSNVWACRELNNLAMALYGQIIKVNAAVKGLNDTETLVESVHDENMRLQGSATACMNQGATPSAACIQLATQDEKLFPLLEKYNAANKILFTDGDKLQEVLNTVLQAYKGLKNCDLPVVLTKDSNTLEIREFTPNAGSAYPYPNPPSISSVFSQSYLDNLDSINAEELSIKLEELSPYYVSKKLLGYVTKQIIAGAGFKADLQSATDYLQDTSKTANAVISITGQGVGSGKFYNELGGSFGGLGGIFSCPGGYYCPKTSPIPVLCPAGSFCPPGDPDSPYLCSDQDPAKPYSDKGASDASQCRSTIPNGYYYIIDTSQNPPKLTQLPCPEGAYCQGGRIYPCPAGTYNSKKASEVPGACLPCPKGAYCPASGNSVDTAIGKVTLGSLSPTPCPPGNYNDLLSQSNSTACRICPAGTTCATKGLSSPIPCPAGTYSSVTELKGECTPGPAGKYSSSTRVPFPSSFTTCSVGHYCPAGANDELPCGPGNYCDAAGMSSPKLCAKGRYGSSSNNTTAQCDGPCAAGYYCDEGSVNAKQGLCPPGYYCPAGTQQPLDCPANKFCVQGTSVPSNCPAGTTSTAGATDITGCDSCPAGSFCPGDGNNPVTCTIGSYCEGGNSAPVPCPAGSYCDVTGLTAGKPCPAGRYNDTAGATLLSQCLPCPAGKFNPGTGQTQCNAICPIGTQCPPGSANPVPCPMGGYCDEEGLASAKLCSPSTYSDAVGATSPATCRPCLPGTYCPSSGGSTGTMCPPGTYCPGGGVNANQCLIGQVCPVTGMTAGAACPAGYYCPTAGGSGAIPCPAGTYSMGGATAACSACPAGKYGSSTATTSAACTGPCAAGYYCPAGSSGEYGGTATTAAASTTPCPAGTYSTGGATSAANCTACPAGKYGSSTAAASAACTGPCAAGYYCPAGSSGQYGNAATTAATSTTPCPAGTYSTGGASSAACTVCPAGTYGSSTAAASASCTGPCTAGYYCPAGSSSQYGGSPSDATNLYICPKGAYCPTGSSTPILCPAGTYNTAFGKTRIEDCIVGIAGRYYCPGTTTSIGASCPAGYYCPTGTGPSITAIPSTPCSGTSDPQYSGSRAMGSRIVGNPPTPCPAGTFNPNPSGSSVASCSACPIGKTSNPGSTSSTACV